MPNNRVDSLVRGLKLAAGLKTCSKCKNTKLIAEFGRSKYTLSGFGVRCSSCNRGVSRDYYNRNPDQANSWNKKNPDKRLACSKKYLDNGGWRITLKRKYGVGPEEYDAMLAKQKGRCGICRVKPFQRLCVDHNHVTKCIRGLLCKPCKPCNAALGRLGDNIESIRRVLAYLEIYES